MALGVPASQRGLFYSRGGQGGLVPCVFPTMRMPPHGVWLWSLKIRYNKALKLHLFQSEDVNLMGNLRDFSSKMLTK